MIIVLTVDDNLGMIFNKRRQSRDRVMLSDLSDMIGNKALICTDFSEKLLREHGIKYIVSSDPVDDAGENDYFFIEDPPIKPYLDKANTVILYKWNKIYPSDKKLDVDLLSEGFKLSGVSEFKGYSHKKITKEFYRK